MICLRPPRGWVCTREPGHENPCAALQFWAAPLDLVLEHWWQEIRFRWLYSWLPKLRGQRTYRCRTEVLYPPDFHTHPEKYIRVIKPRNK